MVPVAVDVVAALDGITAIGHAALAEIAQALLVDQAKLLEGVPVRSTRP